MDCNMPGFPLNITNSQSLLKLMSIESVMPSNHHILCRPFLLPPSIFPSIRVFSKESVLHIRWPKNWSFSFNINPSNKYSGLISFRMDWLDLLAVQGTLKSLLPFAIILCLFWISGHKSCGIVADWPGIESAFPALEGEVLLDLQGRPSTGVYKAIVFAVVMCGCKSWTIKKTECQRIDAFELCWRRFLRIPWKGDPTSPS